MRLLRATAFALAIISSIPLTAAAAGPLTGIEGMSSTVMQKGQSSFSGLGLRARLHPARLISEVELMPALEYWSNNNTERLYGIHSMRKDITLAIDARYTFHPKGWEPYLGAGFGIHFLSSRVDAPSLGIEASDSVTKGGLAALGGVNFPLTERIGNFLELKYHHLSDYGQFKINWGLTYHL